MATKIKAPLSDIPDPVHPVCVKCTFHSTCQRPFRNGIYLNQEGKKRMGMPDFIPEGGWIAVIGDTVSSKGDNEGISLSDDYNILMQQFKELGVAERIWYHPGMACRPPLVGDPPEDPEETDRRPIRQVTKTEINRCYKHFIAPRVAMLAPIAIIAAGPVGGYSVVRRMDTAHLENKLFGYFYNEHTPAFAVRDVEGVLVNRSGAKPFFEALAFAVDSIARAKEIAQERLAQMNLAYVTGFTEDAVLDWLEPVLANLDKPLMWDVESSGVEPFKAGYKVGLFSFYHPSQDKPLMIPTPEYPASFAKFQEVTGIDASEWPAYWEKLVPIIKRILKSDRVYKIGHNLQFDEISINTTYGWEMGGYYADTMIWNYLIHPDEKRLSGLDDLVRKWAPEIPDYWVPLEQYKNQHGTQSYLDIPWDILVPYAAYDTYALWPVFTRIKERMREMHTEMYGGFFVRNMDIAAADGSVNAVPTLSLLKYATYGRRIHQRLCIHLELIGQHLDHELLPRITEHYVKERNGYAVQLNEHSSVKEFCATILGPACGKSTLQYKIWKRSNGTEAPPMNWASNAQVKLFFLTHLGLETSRKTATGNVSVDEGTLASFATQHPAAELLLRWRQSNKFISSFISPISNGKVVWADGMAHSAFKPSGTETSRLATSRPNVQAIPRDGAVKKLYSSRYKGGWMVTRDYSGLEVRIIGCFARDEVLIDTFNHGGDPHMNTQRHFFGDKADKNNKNQRSLCKRALFGKIYGQQAYGLYEQLSTEGVKNPETGLPITLEECQQFLEALAALYIGVEDWCRLSHEHGCHGAWIASAFGFVRPMEALKGFRQYLDAKHDWQAVKNDARFKKLRAAINKDLRRCQNTPIQSTAGDITVFAAYWVNETFKNRGLTSRVVNVVHDDIWTDVPDDGEVLEVVSIMHDVMDFSPEWLPELLPGYDPSWIEIPIIGECDLGINPKDAVKVIEEPTRRNPEQIMEGKMILKVPKEVGKLATGEETEKISWLGNETIVREHLELMRNKL